MENLEISRIDAPLLLFEIPKEVPETYLIEKFLKGMWNPSTTFKLRTAQIEHAAHL